jgi:hypothetical protein
MQSFVISVEELVLPVNPHRPCGGAHVAWCSHD